MLSRWIAARWSELPGVMTGNIIISLSSQFNGHINPSLHQPSVWGWRVCRLHTFSFWGSDRQRRKDGRNERKVEKKGVNFEEKIRGEREEVGRYKDIQRCTERWRGGEGGEQRVRWSRQMGSARNKSDGNKTRDGEERREGKKKTYWQRLLSATSLICHHQSGAVTTSLHQHHATTTWDSGRKRHFSWRTKKQEKLLKTIA